MPYSVHFQDKYFCDEDGLKESLYVFCGGNDLESRWRALPQDRPGTFVIGEAGFGSGLNFLCAWRLWRQCAPDGWTLRYLSIDRYPMSLDDLTRSLMLWPELSELASELIACYPDGPCVFDGGRVVLSLFLKDICASLDEIDYNKSGHSTVDAWFLDGFAPAKNPAMWSEDVFKRMARLSCPGTTVSTFTVAGDVRRGLNRCGFKTGKVPGFGRKRQMLKGVFGTNESEALEVK